MSPPPPPPPPPSTPSPGDAPCPACSPSTPPLISVSTINHSLFHGTTRIPLFVHPPLWYLAHLDLLRVSLVHCPPPAPKPPRPSFPSSTSGIFPLALTHFFLSHKYNGNEPPQLQLLSLVGSAVRALPCSFSISYTPKIILQIGTLPHSILTPFAIISRSTLFFAALTSPATRDRDRSSLRNRHRCPLVHGLVQPSDIALLLALAQLQRSRLPRRQSYAVCVLASDESAMKVRGLQAEVQMEYLDALREPWRVLPVLEVRVWELEVAGGDEVLDVVRAVGEVAVKLKNKKVAKKGLK